MTHLRRAVFAIAALSLVPRAADARPAAKGWYAEVDLGATGALGDAATSVAVGPAIELRGGAHVTSWFAVGVDLATSSHEGTVPAPPSGEWFQLVRGALELRLGGMVGPIGLYLHGQAGAGYISSTLLERVAIQDPGEHLSLAVGGGASMVYQLANRHYALGFGGDVVVLPQFASTQLVQGHLLLRYTF